MPSDIPVPPEHLLPRIGSRAENAAGFAEEGAALKRCLSRSHPPGLPIREGMRCLDFGCGVGRFLFQLEAEAERFEIWGCDLHRQSIEWLRKVRGDRLRLFANDPDPPLPIEDCFFDVVFALSVFTHLADWRGWMVEVGRVLRPGGIGFLSFQGEIPYLREVGDPEELERRGWVVHAPEHSWDRGGPQVYQSNAWTVKRWSEVLPIHRVFEGGLGGFQSLAVVRKGIPLDSPPKVARPFVLQPAGTAFSGYVEYDPWRHNWWERCGWCDDEYEQIHGWIVSRNGPIRRIEAQIAPVGDVEIRLLERADLADHFSDVPWARECGFVVPSAELARVPPGTHDLEVTAEDSKGGSHFLRCTLNRSAPRP